MNGYLFQIAVFAGAEKGLWRAIAIATVVNLASNAIAVVFWGATGAACVMILSELTGLVMYARIYRSKMASPLGRRYPLSVVAASILLTAGVIGVHLGFKVGSGTGVFMIPRIAGLLVLYGALVALISTVVRRWSAAKGAAPTG